MTLPEIATAQESSGWRIWSSFPSHNLTVHHGDFMAVFTWGWLGQAVYAVGSVLDAPKTTDVHAPPAFGILVAPTYQIRSNDMDEVYSILVFLCKSHLLHSFGDASETCLNTCLLSTRSTNYVS